jgi:DNA (cytosine-5)-methyltransferase 3A
MRVLSLFDGISCARVALERAGIEVETYYASEIDKHAIAVSTKNYPDIVQLGSVVGLTPPEDIDLLIGGSPCQDLSIAKKDRKGLDGDRSGLFWEYVRIKDECKPTYFILENVASMPKKDRDLITITLGVQPVLFNASLVSAQCRKRLFWTNLKFELPEDRGILLRDILQPDCDVEERTYDMSSFHKTPQTDRNDTKKLGYIGENDNQAKRVYDDKGKLPALNVVCNSMVKVGHIGNSDAQANRVYDPSGKSCTLSAHGGGLGAKTGLYQTTDRIRKLTPIECERLQSLPDNYTDGIAKTNRYKCLGNAFNVDVVSHILSVLHNG